MLVLTNMGDSPVALPAGFSLALASGPVEDKVPSDTTVYLVPSKS